MKGPRIIRRSSRSGHPKVLGALCRRRGKQSRCRVDVEAIVDKTDQMSGDTMVDQGTKRTR